VKKKPFLFSHWSCLTIHLPPCTHFANWLLWPFLPYPLFIPSYSFCHNHYLIAESFSLVSALFCLCSLTPPSSSKLNGYGCPHWKVRH
jgi:hypothetical protein